MRVMQRGIMRFLPGKMAEGMKLLKEYITIMSKKGMSASAMRTYTPFLGGGDSMHTVIFEFEWDSLTEMATFFEKVWTDPEVVAQMSKWEAVEESHNVELFMIMPQV